MKDYGIIRGLVQQFDTNGQKNGQFFSLRKMVRDYLNKFNVPFYDPCCPAYDQAALSTVGYDAASAGLQYYNESTEAWVSVGSSSSVTALTAFATGGQTSAVALAPGYNEITTVATAGDSVKLPAAAEGIIVIVKNDGATAADVFPATADKINDGTVNVAVRIAPNSTITFRAVDAVNWETDNQVLSTDVISEQTSAAGVTVDGVLLKDGGVKSGTQIAAFYPQVAQTNITAGTGGAIPVTNYLTTINSDAGGDTFTLANGTSIGQMKKILMVADGGGDCVITPATLVGGTTITMNDAADFVILQFNGTAWVVLENSGTTVA